MFVRSDKHETIEFLVPHQVELPGENMFDRYRSLEQAFHDYTQKIADTKI